MNRIARQATRTICPAALVLLVLVPVGCREDRSDGKQLIVLGFDGMDPRLCEQMLNEGRLPNLARLRDAGAFKPLGTSTPPQSPVAWCTLITGTNPGQHGIFDFIHRNPKTYLPFESTAKTVEGRWGLALGKYLFHLKAGKVLNLRQGVPFWEYLTQAGIPTQIYRMPANYPPTPSKGADFACLSDMGTPDMRGTKGEFSFYTSDPWPRKIGGGGDAYSVHFENNVAHTVFHGPPDGLLNPEVVKEAADRQTKTPLTVYRDPTEPTARLVWQDQDVVLAQGQWSDWYPVEFEMGPRWPLLDAPILPGAKAICRFYLKQVRPRFQLYVTPFNIDPLEPSLPISQPDDFATDVAEVIGRHYTQGLPEETKGLTHGVLSRDEFLRQADLVLAERLKMFDYALDHFETGLMFFYFGGTDQVAHMFWGAHDPEHPALTHEEQQKYADVVHAVYERMDTVIAKTMDRFPEATIILLSDHGFDTFTRQFNPNNWLLENGYAVIRDPNAPPGQPLNVDFARSRAYAMGINGLYVNLQGREGMGIVPLAEKQLLMDEIAARLKQYRDPKTGEQVIKEVYQADRVYSGPQVAKGPDMQIGYARSFRASWTAALAGFDNQVMSDNTDAWNADHCIATDLVPGVVFASRSLALEDPTLEDIAPTILAEFGIEIPEQMRQRSLFAHPDKMTARK